MKILYAIVLILISGLTFAQEIEMGPTGNTSVFLRLDAMKDSVGDATLSIRRSTSEDAGLIKFSLDDLESFSGLVSSSNWHFGLDGDDHLKFTHFYEDFFSELERKTKVDALVIDATDEGTHKNPIVILPQGKLQIGTEIQLESRTDNSLALLDGDFIPGNSYGIYDLGNNEDDERIATSVGLGYDHQINDLSGIGLDFDFGLTEATTTSNRVESSSLSLTYRHAITEDWNLQTGVSHEIRDEGTVGTADSTSVFVSLQRKFDLIP